MQINEKLISELEKKINQHMNSVASAAGDLNQVVSSMSAGVADNNYSGSSMEHKQNALGISQSNLENAKADLGDSINEAKSVIATIESNIRSLTNDKNILNNAQNNQSLGGGYSHGASYLQQDIDIHSKWKLHLINLIQKSDSAFAAGAGISIDNLVSGGIKSHHVKSSLYNAAPTIDEQLNYKESSGNNYKRNRNQPYFITEMLTGVPKYVRYQNSFNYATPTKNYNLNDLIFKNSYNQNNKVNENVYNRVKKSYISSTQDLNRHISSGFGGEYEVNL